MIVDIVVISENPEVNNKKASDILEQDNYSSLFLINSSNSLFTNSKDGRPVTCFLSLISHVCL
jgi:hypothetical protein